MRTRHKMILGGIATGTLLAGAGTVIGAALAGRRLARAVNDWRGHNIRGKTVLITGSSRGLGLAMAEEFAQHGCNIILCARDEEDLAGAREQVERHGAEVATIVCDVTKKADVERMIETARERFGTIDILVNNAGIIAVGPILSHTPQDFEEAMDVMFWGVVHPTLAVLPEMVRRGEGQIVNITSIGGKVSVPHLVPYCSAKFAATGFSEGLHAELKRYGINVLTVVPGLMRTGSYRNAFFKGQNDKEYGWFALSGNNPLFSISASRAARQVVNATRRHQAELIISWQAELLARTHGIAPGLVTEALALVNTLLPSEEGGTREKVAGHASETGVTRSPLTFLGQRAAKRYNQKPRPA